MDATGDRLEVVDRELVRIDTAVPADHVKGVMLVDELGHAALVFDEYLDPRSVTQKRLGRAVEIAFAVRGAFEELAIARQVSSRWSDVAAGLEDQRPNRVGRVIEDVPVDHGRGDDKVVTRAKLDRAKHGFERSRPLFDVDHFVAEGVFL